MMSARLLIGLHAPSAGSIRGRLVDGTVAADCHSFVAGRVVLRVVPTSASLDEVSSASGGIDGARADEELFVLCLPLLFSLLLLFEFDLRGRPRFRISTSAQRCALPMAIHRRHGRVLCARARVAKDEHKGP